MSTAGTVAGDLPPPLEESRAGLRKSVLRGSMITIVGRLIGTVIRFGSNLVLTHLLVPEYFGVMAIVNVTLTGLHMFSDLGVGTAIIQSEHGDEPRFLRTAYSLQVIRGLWLTTAGCLLAWPLAQVYDKMPQLIWAIPIASVTALIDGLTSTKLFRENRHLRLGRLTVIEAVCAAVAATTMIATAYFTRSIVGLLVGGIASGFLRLALSHLWLPGEPDRFGWDPEARKSLLRFGRWIFLSTALSFVAMQIDRLTLGRLIDPAALGIYSIAAMIAFVPRETLGELSQRVLYPLVARTLRRGEGGEAIRTMRVRLMLLLSVPMAILIGESEPLFHWLFGQRYQTGGSLMAVLCLGTWLNTVATTYGVVVLSKGWPHWISYGTGAKALVFAAAVVPVHRAFGVWGVAALISLSEVAVAVAAGLGSRAVGVTTFALDLACTVAVIAGAFGVSAVQKVLTRALGNALPGMLLAGLAAVAWALWLARSYGILRRSPTA